MNRVIIWLRSNPAQTIDTTRKEHQAGKTRMKINNTDMFNTSMLEAIRQPNPVTKSLALVVLGFFLSTFYAPSAKAIQLGVEHDKRQSAIQASLDTKSSGLKYTELLKEMKGQFKEAQYLYEQQFDNTFALKADLQSALKGGSLIVKKDDWRKTLNQAIALRKEASQYHEDILKSFEADESWAKNANLSEEIIQRQQESYATFQERYDTFNELADALEAAPEGEEQIDALNALNEKLGEWQFQKRHIPLFDPENNPLQQTQLPWSVKDPSQTREPVNINESNKTTNAFGVQLKNLLLSSIPVAHAQTTPMLPTANDLAETPDIKLTESILDLAESLDKNPVKIYEWVRNNIEYIPTYGSIQGADYTLKTGKGNAFDTSSLLIALYRASGIAAKYNYGVVRIPVDQAMNWVGGATDPSAVGNILGQGGIPNRALATGGEIKFYEIEHVWVQAWLDYFPSRAAKNIEGDSWVSLDASYKQYDYISAKFDFKNLQFEGKDYIQSLGGSWTNWNQTIDQAQMDSALENMETAIDQALDQEPNFSTDFDEQLGSRRLIVKEYGIVAASLPYKLVNKTEEFSEISDQRRHKFRYELRDKNSSSIIQYSASLPELTSNNISIGFKPETENDKAIFENALPINSDATISDLPDQLRSYLVKMKPELKQNNTLVSEGAALTLGEDVIHFTSLYSPYDGWRSRTKPGVVGEYRALGFDFGGVEDVEADEAKIDLMGVLDQIDQGETEISKTDFVDNLMHMGVKYYFALFNRVSQFNAAASDVIYYRKPSYGYFHTNVSTIYSFGVPRSVQFDGVTMDLPYVQLSSVSKDNNDQKRLNFNYQTGLLGSHMEGSIPEALFFTGNQQPTGVSAAQALSYAVDEGQTVYTLTPSDNTSLSNVTINASDRTEIRNALLTGKNVVVHERPVSVINWTGSGYLILDPPTGSGAYLISGGADGGFLGIEESTWLAFLSAGVDFIPGIGSVKLIIELITGKDLITGQPINRFMHSFAVLASFVVGAGAGLALTKAMGKLIKSGKSSNAIGQAGEAAVNAAKRVITPLSRRERGFTINGRNRIADGADVAINPPDSIPSVVWEVKNVKTLTGAKIQDQLQDYVDLCMNLGCKAELFIRGPLSQQGPTHITSGMRDFLCNAAIDVLEIGALPGSGTLNINCP